MRKREPIVIYGKDIEVDFLDEEIKRLQYPGKLPDNIEEMRALLLFHGRRYSEPDWSPEMEFLQVKLSNGRLCEASVIINSVIEHNVKEIMFVACQSGILVDGLAQEGVPKDVIILINGNKNVYSKKTHNVLMNRFVNESSSMEDNFAEIVATCAQDQVLFYKGEVYKAPYGASISPASPQFLRKEFWKTNHLQKFDKDNSSWEGVKHDDPYADTLYKKISNRVGNITEEEEIIFRKRAFLNAVHDLDFQRVDDLFQQFGDELLGEVDGAFPLMSLTGVSNRNIEAEEDKQKEKDIWQMFLKLKDYGVDLNVKDNRNMTVLHYACISDPIVAMNMMNRLHLTNELLDQQECQKGFSALHIMCELGDVGFYLAQALLSKRVNVDSIGKDGIRPLHIACACKDINLVELLVSYNAELDGKMVHEDGQEYTAVQMACAEESYDIALFLIQKDCDISSLTKKEKEGILDYLSKPHIDRLTVINVMHKLQKGTLESFVARVAEREDSHPDITGKLP